MEYGKCKIPNVTPKQLREHEQTMATSSQNGHMTSEMAAKLNNIHDSANNYEHPDSNVTAGTYRQVTVDAQGHVTTGNNSAVPVNQGGTGASTGGQAVINLGAAPKSHAVSTTEYGLGTTTNYGHVKVSSNNGLTISNGNIQMAEASTSEKGAVQLNDTLNSSAKNQALTANQGRALNEALKNKANTTGDLGTSANRYNTIYVDNIKLKGHCSIISDGDTVSLLNNYSVYSMDPDNENWNPMHATEFIDQSSKRFKDDIKDMTEAQALKLLQFRPVTFLPKNTTDNRRKIGLIAEEVEKIDNTTVGYSPDGEVEGLNYSVLSAQIIKLAQIQEKHINDLEKRIEQLEKRA